MPAWIKSRRRYFSPARSASGARRMRSRSGCTSSPAWENTP
jgi:hypothetical protein